MVGKWASLKISNKITPLVSQRSQIRCCILFFGIGQANEDVRTKQNKEYYKLSRKKLDFLNW